MGFTCGNFSDLLLKQIHPAQKAATGSAVAQKDLNDNSKFENIGDAKEPGEFFRFESWARNAFRAQEYDEAETHYKRLLVAWLDIYTMRSQEIVDVLRNLAVIAKRQVRLVEATEILCTVREIQPKLVPAVDTSETFEITKRLTDLYARRNMHNEALEMVQTVIAHKEETLGRMDNETLEALMMKQEILENKGKQDKQALIQAEEVGFIIEKRKLFADFEENRKRRKSLRESTFKGGDEWHGCFFEDS